MDRGRKGKRKGKKGDATEVRPPSQEKIIDLMESRIRAVPAQFGKLWQQQVEKAIYSAPDDYVPEPPRMEVSTDDLNKLLAALQDGVAGYGEKDCELIAEIVCELIEYRKKDPKRLFFRGQEMKLDGGQKYYQGYDQIQLNSDQFWRAPEKSREQSATEQHIELQRRMQELARYSDHRAKSRSWRWESDISQDCMVLFAPDGSRRFTWSQLAMMNMPRDEIEREKKRIESREKMRWEAERYGQQMQQIQGFNP